MIDNSNPYTLRSVTDGDITHYFVSFYDEEGKHQEAEVSETVYLEFKKFVIVERNLRRWDERHLEQSQLSEREIYSRAFNPPLSSEDAAIARILEENLQHIVHQLPKKQRRRFVLYYEYGLNYSQIANIEGCSRVAVKYSFDKIKLRIEKIIKDFFD